MLNYYRIDNALYLVDLPDTACAGSLACVRPGPAGQKCLERRTELKAIIQLIDARLEWIWR